MAENKPQLTKSQVVFYDDNVEDEALRHTYWLRNKQLKGVTSTLLKFAFPDMYKGISKETLNKAASRGKGVHEAVQALSLFGGEATTPEESNFLNIVNDNKLTMLDYEYLVSDNKHFASAIDIVALNKDGEVILIDIKTTAERHYDAVSLQLSIYADWFEQMNPEHKVAGLYLLWLRGDEARYEEVPRVGTSKIKQLIRAWQKQDEAYKYDDSPKWLKRTSHTMAMLTSKIEELTQQLEELKAETLQKMTDEHYYALKDCGICISKVAATTGTKFNSTAFKKDHPEEYAKYLQTVSKKEYLTIKKSK